MKPDLDIDEEVIKEDRKNIKKAIELLSDCLTLNSIETSHGVHAMINIILGTFKSDELRDKFVSLFHRLVDEEMHDN
jgi:hypothetical protein